jgi:hypothetical protein
MLRSASLTTLLAAILLAVLVATPPLASADQVDVVVQAGHQGRPQSCIALHVAACNLGTGLGDQRERDWTPIVADTAAAALRRGGLRVKRRPADYRGFDHARAAVFLHFDGSAPPCRSGASVGFPRTTDAAFVRAWENRYRPSFPFRFAGENITTNESRYYGFRKVDAPGKALLIEFGEMTCPAQERWMAPRLHQFGLEVARFISAELRP